MSRDVAVLPEFPCHEFHRDGRVYRVRGVGKRGEVRSHVGNPQGHYKIRLMVKGKRYTFWTHRLICRAFHGEPPRYVIGKTYVRHLDSNPANNHADNLRWGSRSENEQDKRNFTGELDPVEEAPQCYNEEGVLSSGFDEDLPF